MRCICWAWCASIGRSLADAVGYLTRAARERPDDAQVTLSSGHRAAGTEAVPAGGAASAARGCAAARRSRARSTTSATRLPAWAARGGDRSAIGRCWRSMPAMHRRTTIWAARWPRWIGWRRRLPAFARRWNMRRRYRCRTGWPMCMPAWARRWSVSGATTRRSPPAARSPHSSRRWRSGTKAWSCCCSAATPRDGGNTKAAGASPTMIRRARMRVYRSWRRSPASASC